MTVCSKWFRPGLHDTQRTESKDCKTAPRVTKSGVPNLVYLFHISQTQRSLVAIRIPRCKTSPLNVSVGIYQYAK